jgi:hypothetical protein
MAFSLTQDSISPQSVRFGILNLTDSELVGFLEQRDGKMPLRSPSHLLNGTCKYAAYYVPGECPWCYYAFLSRSAA